MTVPGVICLLLIVLSFFRAAKWLSLVLLFVFAAFGALDVVDPDYSAGANIIVGSLAAVAFVIITFLKSENRAKIFSQITNSRGFGLLSLFIALSLLSAAFYPLIFSGKIYVFALSHSTRGVERISPVQSSMQNFTQSAYLLISFLVAVATALNFKIKNFNEALLQAIFYGGVAIVATGCVDFVLSLMGDTGVGEMLLNQFKNASYVLHENASISGSRRAIGFMSEASVFSFIAGQFGALLLFLRPMYAGQSFARYVSWLALACIAFAALSLSSTGILTVIAIGLVYFADLMLRRAQTPVDRSRIEMAIVVAVFAVFIFTILSAQAEFSDQIESIFESLTIGKQYSASYKERMSWNSSALNAFWESYGVGVGVGTLRVSNFFVGLLGATGVVGIVLFGLFNLQVFWLRAPKADAPTQTAMRGFKMALIPSMVSLATSGTTTDFGPIVGVCYGAIIGLHLYGLKSAESAKVSKSAKPMRRRSASKA